MTLLKEDITLWENGWQAECKLAQKENRPPNPLFDKMSYKEYNTVEILSEEMDEINERYKNHEQVPL